MNSIFLKAKYKTNIYFVRHAESEYNLKGLVAGTANPGLTELGINQATQTSGFFKNVPISQIFYSPLLRAAQTAKYVSQQIPNPNLIACPELVEIESGYFTGKSIEQISKDEPKIYYQFKKESWQGVAGAERIETLLARAKTFWELIINAANSNNKDSNILAVTHGGFMQWIIKTSLALSGSHTETWAPIFKVSNCSIFNLEIEPVFDLSKKHDGVYAYWKLLNFICYN